MKLKKRIVAIGLCASLVMTGILGNVTFASTESTVKKAWKDKVSTELYNKVVTCDDENEKISVYVWYKDINKEKVEEKVEEETGLKKDEIRTMFAVPTIELWSEVANFSMGSEDELEVIRHKMEEYLKKTEEIRKKESENVEKYLTEWRRSAKEFYKERSSEVERNLEIEQKKIDFTSQYVPMMIVEMTCAEIKEAAENDTIENMDLCEEKEMVTTANNSLSDMKSINGFNEMYAQTIQKIALKIL